MLPIWQLFKEELELSVVPKRDETIALLNELLNQTIINEIQLGRLIQVREMAFFEEALIDYLHAPFDWKQASIKAEFVHLGTLFEALLGFLTKKLFNQGKVDLAFIRSCDISGEENKLIDKINQVNLSFNNYCVITSKYIRGYIINNTVTSVRKVSLNELIRTINELREERNKVHINKINPRNILEDVHDLPRLITTRSRFTYLIKEILELTTPIIN